MIILRVAGMAGAVLLAGYACFGETPCASTPLAAARAFERGEPVAGNAAEGFRVVGSRDDLVLGVSWAQVERCGHPGWPEVSVAMQRRPERAVSLRTEKVVASGGSVSTVLVSATAGVPAQVRMVVRAGETVRLWRSEPNLRMEMPAVTEESGGLGERVRLRVISRQEGIEVVRYLFGTVRGPADVELES